MVINKFMIITKFYSSNNIKCSIQMEKTMVINNNNHSFHQMEAEVCKNTKLIPDKFTFLKSNQLITRYIKKGNVIENILRKTVNVPSSSFNNQNAYDSSVDEVKKYESQKKLNEYKIQKALEQAKSQLENYKKQKVSEKSDLDSKVKKIQLMVQTMLLKASDIMYGRNNSTYCRRQIDTDQVPLKELKNTTCDRSLKKIECTRKNMISISKKMLQKLPYSSLKQLQSSKLSDSFSECQGNSSIMTNSFVSMERQAKQKKKKGEDSYKKQLQIKSFETVYNSKRRNVANQAFGLCWQLGNTDKKLKKINLFENLAKTVKNKSNLKAKKSERASTSLLDQLKQDQKCELVVNKKYCKNFQNFTDNFKIVSKEESQ